jgi:LysM repeat protein
MKKIFLVLVAFTACCVLHAQNDAINQYIARYNEVAIKEMMRSGVPAAITLAQGILESQAGQSDLVLQSNNHFGIKCKSDWTGDKVYHDDDAKAECFRSYPSAEDSYRDHSDFLKNRPNYAFLFQLDPTDYEGWARGLKKAGYATEKDYAPTLIKMIVSYNLQQYSLTALQRMKTSNTDWAITQKNTRETHDANNGTAVKTATPVPMQQNNPSNDKDTYTATIAQTRVQAPQINYPTGVFSINDTKVVFAPAGTSLFALSNNYNIAFAKLLEYNEISKTDILSSGSLIFLEKKPKKGNKDYHIVCSGECIKDIAQTEGVRMESLMELNQLQKGMEPAVGEKVYLRSIAPAAPKLASSFTNK